MWLLHAETKRLKCFHDEAAYKQGYAILSHTWGEEEVTFQDVKSLEIASQMAGFEKIHLTCQQAKRDGISYVWIDTCCIDKSSSAELSEAINSMFKWYQRSTVCYAYLVDLQVSEQTPLDRALAKSKWFTRGWTLQELIAPSYVYFFGQGWTFCGEKHALSRQLARITSIDRGTLMDSGRLGEACIAKKLSWAADRQTTRVEDRAYSLLGLLDVNMPLLYGEGDKAFIRLQHEILRTTTDHSILLWHPIARSEAVQVLPHSPSCYKGCQRITQYVWRRPMPFEMTSVGLRLTAPTLKIKQRDGMQDELAIILNCRYENDFTGPIVLISDRWHNSKDGSVTMLEQVYRSSLRDSPGGRSSTIEHERLIETISQTVLLPALTSRHT